jgi:hypothetical protein
VPNDRKSPVFRNFRNAKAVLRSQQTAAPSIAFAIARAAFFARTLALAMRPAMACDAIVDIGDAFAAMLGEDRGGPMFVATLACV